MSTLRHHNVISQIKAALLQFGSDTRAYSVLGDIRAVLHPTAPLILLNYTDQATFNRRWNEVERACRGLIGNYQTGELVAWPLPKFFNLGEMPETSLENLPAGDYIVSDKLDGSCGVLYRNPDTGVYEVATRGNFSSDQARWATRYLNSHYDLSQLDPDLTLVFEIIYPENRVILDYGSTRGLFLLAVLNHRTGEEWSWEQTTLLATEFKLPVVAVYPKLSLAELLQAVPVSTGIEGWVVRYPSGLRIKIKTEEYATLHRLVANFTPTRVLEAVQAGTYHSYLVSLPEELRLEAEQIYAELSNYIQAETKRLTEVLATLPKTNRRELAMAINAREVADRGRLFCLYDGKDLSALLMKHYVVPDQTVVAAEKSRVLES